MRAIIFEEFGGPLTIQHVPDPTPPDDGVVIAVKANGICRSDWHGWQGHDPDIKLPHVPGHELAGEVAAVGPQVQDWQPGDRVTVPFAVGCGRCAQCRAGHHQVCDNYFQPGFTAWGACAEYVAIPHADANLVRLPETISFAAAASLGCRFGTAFRAVVAQGRIRSGQWLAVYGCGGVGLSAVMIGAALGAIVVAVDIQDAALQLAEQVGAAHTLNARQVSDVPAAIRQLSGGGAHVSLDALGSAATCRDSILSLRKRGRHVQVGLLVADDSQPPLPMGPVVAGELEIVGSHGLAAHAYDDMLAMIAHGTLQPEQLISRTVSLDDVPAILAQMTTFQTTGVAVITDF